MSWMLERIARAICFRRHRNSICGHVGASCILLGRCVGPLDRLSEPSLDAAAALEPMRNPTPEMIEAGADLIRNNPNMSASTAAEEIWRAMIDEARKA